MTPDNKIVSCSLDGTIRMWDIQGRCLALCKDGFTEDTNDLPLTVTHDNKVIFKGTDKYLRICDFGIIAEIDQMGQAAFASIPKSKALWTVLGNYLPGNNSRDYLRAMRDIVDCTQDDELQTISARFARRRLSAVSSATRSRPKRGNDAAESSTSTKRPKGN